MKILLVKLKQKSLLLSGLQSDTIFGHFCWRMAELRGDDVLTEFLELYSAGQPIFTISDAFQGTEELTLLPRPFLPPDFSIKPGRDKKQKIINFLLGKIMKSKKLIPIDAFNHIINGRIRDALDIISCEYEIPSLENDLRISVEIDRDTFAAKEGRLFQSNPHYTSENTVQNVFIKVINEVLFEKYKCENIIKETFTTGYGRKKSSGYGEFEIISFKEFKEFREPESPNAFVALGNYLPSKEDMLILDNSNYDIFVKYGKLGEEYAHNSNPFKKPIVFMTPGSCFRTENARSEHHGRITTNMEVSSVKNVIQNGIPFTLKMIMN
jgi:CRISPR-associated protein Csm4